MLGHETPKRWDAPFTEEAYFWGELFTRELRFRVPFERSMILAAFGALAVRAWLFRFIDARAPGPGGSTA